MPRSFLTLALVALTVAALSQGSLWAQLTEPSIAAADLAAKLPAGPTALDIDLLEDETKEDLDFEEDLADAEKSCQEAIRRANRDTKTRTIIQCFRAELQLEVTRLRGMQQELRKLSASDAVTGLRSASDDLLQALVTIIDGIDNGVFTEEADALDSKKRLFEHYRIPFWLARTHLTRMTLLSQVKTVAEGIAALPAEEQSSLQWQTDCLHAAVLPLLDPPADLQSLQHGTLQAATDTQACLTAPATGTGTSL